MSGVGSLLDSPNNPHKRSTPLIRTDQIIEELFTRTRAGVYARYRRGRPVVAVNGPFTNQLGLSLFIEHELHGLPVPERIKRTGDQASEQAWQNGQLDLLTTDELISRLYQRPGPWVLGLMRQAPKEQHLQAGTFYRGDPIACAGLAGHLGWLIAKNVLHNRLRRCERSSEPIDAVRDLVDLITSRIDDGHPQVLFISGQSILLEHALRATLKSRR